MREALSESGLKEPTFDADGYFRTVFYRPGGVGMGTLGAGGSWESTQKGSQKTSQKIISLIAAKPEITIDEMADKLDISPRAVKKHLHNLKGTGLLKRIGPDKGGYWKAVQ
ncbi:MAG: HTH domain-containing protein [Candidatus Aureabacteria bacterium]|nr:HTH domain-containing protein [Candidatus Auribacterota bacterium]